MNYTLLQNPSKKGYLLIPRILLQAALKRHSSYVMSEEEAFLIILYKAYHTDFEKKKYPLKRGDCDLSIRQWSHLLGWSPWKVSRFFDELYAQKQIDYIQQGKFRVIRILNYELFCGNQTKKGNDPEEIPLNKSQRMFIEFWESYHELTLLEPTELEAAKRIWKRLPLLERQMAINNIYEYVMRTELKKDIKKAYRYLLDKEFK